MFKIKYYSGIKRKEEGMAYLFLAPMLIGFVIFILFPVVYSLFVSFTKWNILAGFSSPEFVGMKNYIELFDDIRFMAALKNNFLFTAVTIPVGIILALFIAILLNKKILLRGTIRGMIYMPYITNMIAVSVVFMVLYHPRLGPINSFLRWLGVNNPPGWISSISWALPAIMLMYIWKQLGYQIVILLAGLQGIPRSLMEAADIDGASFWQKLIYITIPQLSPTIFFLLITGVIGSFKIFGAVSIMTQGGPGISTQVLVYHIFRTGFKFYQGGYASAIAWVLFLIIFIFTMIQWYGQKKWVHYE